MSDLISRSKLIKALDKYCGSQRYLVSENIREIINNQPTAYDADRVVEELQSEVERWEDSGKEYGDLCEIALARGLRNAIEIVKQGCVSDNVCLWGKGSSGYVGYPAYYSKCCTTKSKGIEMQTHIIADWKFCPYCGKKIKVV